MNHEQPDRKPFQSIGLGTLLITLLGLLFSCTPPNPSPEPLEASITPPACTTIGQRWVSPVDGMMSVCVPAGDFWMGAGENDPLAEPDEKPQHQVYLDAYWIDRTEVTNAMFSNCVEAGVCHPREYSPYLWGVRLPNGTPYYGEVDYADYPVIMLDSDEASAYCQWVGRRLPTEAEWEKAARGVDQRLYPWGTELDCEHASYLGCEKGPVNIATRDLGSSPYGALNMAGNLWEWTSDWYDANYYPQSPAQNPLGPAAGEYRTLRGGGWRSLPAQTRAANRSTGKPEHSTDGEIGIRCALSVETP